MNKRMNRVALAGVLLAGAACTKQGETNDQGLAGTWQWLRTNGGIAVQIQETPASTGRNIQLKLEQDNRYFIYTNGILTAQGTYQLKAMSCIHDHKEKSFIDFSSENDRDMMVERQEGLVLQLSDEMHDGVHSYFQRVGRKPL